MSSPTEESVVVQSSILAMRSVRYIHCNPVLLLRLLLGLWRWQLEALGPAVVAGANLFPGAGAALKVAERLGQLERLSDDALLLLVEPDLGVTGQGEILAKGVALKAVVGHDTTEIGVADKEDSKKIVGLALVPVGSVKEASDAGHGRNLVGVGLDADSGVVANAEKVVDNLESLVARGVIDGRDGADLRELGRGVV